MASRLAPRILGGLVLLGGAAFLYRSTARFVWNAWTTDPYYTHGILAAAIAVVLATLYLRKETRAADRDTRPAELLGLPVAAGAFFAGFYYHSAYTLAWSAWALLAAIALATGGAARLRGLAAPLLLLGLAIPVPFAINVGLFLQSVAFAASAGILSLVGVDLTAGITTFDVGGLSFEVTPQCSGFQSAISLLAIGALIVALVPSMTRRRKALVLGAAVPLALVLNVARILAVVAIGLRYGADAAEGFFHSWSSAILFLVETAALLAIAGLFARRTKGVRPVEAK